MNVDIMIGNIYANFFCTKAIVIYGSKMISTIPYNSLILKAKPATLEKIKKEKSPQT